MKKKVLKHLGKTTAKRASGSGVGVLRAQVTSALVGAGAAFATYRLLRSAN
jgi:hypothetical protein